MVQTLKMWMVSLCPDRYAFPTIGVRADAKFKKNFNNKGLSKKKSYVKSVLKILEYNHIPHLT